MHNQRTQSRNALTIFGVCLMLLLNACYPATKPLRFTDVSVSPEPVVGEIVTVEVELTSEGDAPDVTFTVDTLESAGNKIHLVSDDPTWQGALVANQPQTFKFSVCVLEEGSWPIEIHALARFPDDDDIWDDFEIIHLESSLTSGRLIRGSEYTIDRNFATPLPTPRPAVVSAECSGQQP